MKTLVNHVCRLAAALLLLPVLISAGVNVSGMVHEFRLDRRVPLARVRVQAQSPNRSELFAAVLTDRKGRYLLPNLPAERFVLTASRVGYYTQNAGGDVRERIVLDCSQPQDCDSVDFVMGRAGVVSGRVVDEFGDPLQDVRVHSRLLDETGRNDGRSWRPSSSTDDRGYFRIHSLPAGRYRVETERNLHPNAAPRHGEPLELEIEPGDEISGLQITMSREQVSYLRVSGKIEGVDLARDGVHFVGVQPTRSRSRGWFRSQSHSVGPDGAFAFHNLQPGRYRFFYTRRGHASGEGRESVMLDIVELKADVSGLVLRPVERTTLRGSVSFESQPPTNPVSITLVSKDNEGQSQNTTAEPPDFQFEATNFLPGTYEVRIRDQIQTNRYYLKGLRKGSEIDRSRVVRLSAGTVESLELVAAGDFSRITGRVKAPPAVQQGRARVGAQFWVALKGPEGVRTVQADQHGGFVFDQVVPGEQRIGAWERLSRQAVRGDVFWEEAKEVLRGFDAEAGSEIEIELTAAP